MKSVPRLAWATLVAVFALASMALADQTAPTATLPSPADKLVVAVSPRDDTANVLLVNNDRLALLKSIKVGKGPQEVCLTPDGSKAYVSNTGGDGLTVIDLATLTVTGTVADAGVKGPAGAAFTPDGKKLYVAARGTQALFVLSPTGQILKQVPMKDPTMVAVSPDGRRVYAASDSTQSVLVFDTATDTQVATIKTSRQPHGLAFTNDGKTLLVTCIAHDVMHYVSTATNEVLTTVGVGRSPQSVAVTPDGRLAFSVTREVRAGGVGGVVSTVSVMDLRGNYWRKVKDILVEPMASKVVVSADGAFLYVTCGAAEPSKTITIIDVLTLEIVRFANGGTGAMGMVYRK
ncbi:MAG TPA: cytochrome D1 domain-containing protein [Vicinamibacterales bacterium]|jgi:YVTN family beta-propeller protein